MMGLWGCGQRSGVVHISTVYRRLENLARGLVTQCLVQALVVVEAQPAADATARLRDRGVSLDVDFLVLQAAPQPLDENVVEVTAFAIHADADTAGRQHAGERGTGELHALIRVENFGRTMPIQRLLQGLDTEPGVHASRQTPGENPAAEP